MAKRDRSNLLKNLLVMGAAGAGLLVGVPAFAQSSESGAAESTAPEEFRLSAEGFKILCENFPLNSRCQGGGEQPSVVPETTPRESLNPGTSAEPSFPSAPSAAPEAPSDTTAPSYEPSAPSTEPSGGMSPQPSDGMSPAPGSVDVPQPSLPSVPDSPKPQSLTVPDATPKGERSGTPAAPAEAPTAPSAAPAAPGAPGTTPQSAPSAPSAPSAAPSSGTPAAPAVTEVSDAELQQFAKVIPELQEIQQSAQQQVSAAIQEAGLSEDRFRELYTAQQAPAGAAAQPSTSAATPQEQQAVEQVVTQLETIKNETQTRREAAVRSQGLEVNRFNEILAAVRQDSGLQQQLQQILNN